MSETPNPHRRLNDPADVTNLLLSAAGVSLDHSPVLPVLFKKAARVAAKRLGELAGREADWRLEDVGIVEEADADEARPVEFTAVFKAPGWQARIVMRLDRPGIFALTDALLGGDEAAEAGEMPETISHMEQRMATIAAVDFAEALRQAVAPVAETGFVLDRAGCDVDVSFLDRERTGPLQVGFKLALPGASGALTLIIPQSALNPFRHQLRRALSGETPAPERSWLMHFQGEVQRTGLTLTATADLGPMTLGQIDRLRPGQVLVFAASGPAPVKVVCNGRDLMMCRLETEAGRNLLTVDGFIDRRSKLLDDIGEA